MLGSDARRLAVRFAAVASAATASLYGFTGAASAAPAPVAPATGTVLEAGVAGAIPDSYIVVLKAGASASPDLVAGYGGQVLNKYQATVRGFHARMSAEQAARLAADPAVQYVEQDAVIGASSVQSNATWGLDRIDQRDRTLDRKYTYGSAKDVTAYVIDTGIRTSHKDFGGRASSGWDFVDGDKTADDCNGHGTHVAGTIGGATYGVAKDIKLVGVKVLDCDGSGSYSDFIAGIDWVTAHAKLPAVANMSIGGPQSKALDDAVDRSIAKGVVYAIAAGNDNKNACRFSPSDTSNAITVGAIDNADKRASFSNYGSCVDIFAPGVNIKSASSDSNSGTEIMSGTSMASPHVAGAAALVLGAHPTWTPQQVRDDLVAHADAGLIRNPGTGSPNRSLYTGYLYETGSAAKKH
ncbi:peptidase S8 [Actinoplanes sp. SE50]|uniref:S8 family peptidase n=1 Tax=unclassified Actinoplanes TaxID=2626549 RepID=UPI00023EDEB3|nr:MULTISPECIES: S8 family peptidase [unclassified Actinoplanes]AEV88767.1 peptidase S8/S53 subtilisin kexin sedolisin [Actinoplanes sp. SE50/110]ATO87173.1 peptidase S8 [Actinoplanes sp. SE50]SLM04591.1 peptidase S8 [Actinoplanes sp. SE50/110]